MKTQLITKRKLQSSIMQFAIISLVILAIGGYFGYRNYTEYQATQSAFEAETNQLSQLKAAADKNNSEYLALKKTFDAQNSGVNQSIDIILPPNEDFTTLARKLDEYFINTSGQPNALFLSDLRFNPPRVDDQSEFGVLPFAMTIAGNDSGFRDFLNYIEQTGDLNGQTRLLDISSMNFSFASNENSDASTIDGVTTQALPTKEISASINLNAYFQKPSADDKTAQ